MLVNDELGKRIAADAVQDLQFQIMNNIYWHCCEVLDKNYYFLSRQFHNIIEKDEIGGYFFWEEKLI